MHDGEIDVTDIVRGFVVLDEAASRVIGLDHEIVAGLDPRHNGNVWVPAIVNHVVLVGRLRQINFDERLWLSRQRTACREHLIHDSTPLGLTSQTARKRAIAASSICPRVSACTMRPPSMTRTRSAMSSTKLSTCSQTTMQRLRML